MLRISAGKKAAMRQERKLFLHFWFPPQCKNLHSPPLELKCWMYFLFQCGSRALNKNTVPPTGRNFGRKKTSGRLKISVAEEIYTEKGGRKVTELFTM
jgi:hypothetical protein